MFCFEMATGGVTHQIRRIRRSGEVW